MKNIQEWLDKNYPLDGDNFGNTRNLIPSIPFNSVDPKLFKEDLSFEGFTNLEEISCNLNQLLFFLQNGLEKLPKKLRRIILYKFNTEEFTTDEIDKTRDLIRERIGLSYLKQEINSYEDINKVHQKSGKYFFDVAVWRSLYNSHLRSENRYSDFFSKQLEMKNKFFIEKSEELTNNLVEKEKELEEKKEEIENILVCNYTLGTIINDSNERNKDLQEEVEDLKKQIILVRDELKKKDTDIELGIETMKSINEFDLARKDEVIESLEKQLTKQFGIFKNVENLGKNSTYYIQATEKIRELENEIKHLKTDLKIKNDKYEKLIGNYNKLSGSVGIGMEIPLVHSRKGSNASLTEAVRTLFRSDRNSPSFQNLLGNKIMSEGIEEERIEVLAEVREEKERDDKLENLIQCREDI